MRRRTLHKALARLRAEGRGEGVQVIATPVGLEHPDLVGPALATWTTRRTRRDEQALPAGERLILEKAEAEAYDTLCANWRKRKT